MDYRQRFEHFYARFMTTSLWSDMVATVENSPWHREANVGVHTQMVVEQFMQRTQDVVWSKDHLVGALACMFHDIGKPASMEHVYSEERGNYVRFRGHELVSARLAETYLVEEWAEFRDTLEPFDIYSICWLVEHHLPFAVQKPHKRASIKTVVDSLFREDPSVFETMILSDQYGRISDDAESKLAKVHQWIQEFAEWPKKSPTELTDQPTLLMLVGVSSSGKSTYASSIKDSEDDFVLFSWDRMRLDRYPMPRSLDVGDVSERERYHYAFNMSCNDPTFYPSTIDHFNALLREKRNIVVDNMNLSEKRRRQFAELAARKGYFVSAMVFPASLSVLQARDAARGDRGLGADVIRDMYMRLTYPSLSEYCHSITVNDGNLVKE